MKITVDTNIPIRAVVRDDVKRVYGLTHKDIHAALQTLLNVGTVAVNRPAVDAGLTALDAGGDFADGLIAFEGQWIGKETFISFDKKAVALLAEQGQGVSDYGG
jgi:predicted nucleic-acid-binding protein